MVRQRGRPATLLFTDLQYRARVRNSRYWGEMLLSPIHFCDVTKPPYLLSGELCTSPLHSNRLYVYTVCCRRGGQCFSVLRTRHTDVEGDSSGRSYVTEQGHNVPLLCTRGIVASSHLIPWPILCRTRVEDVLCLVLHRPVQLKNCKKMVMTSLWWENIWVVKWKNMISDIFHFLQESVLKCMNLTYPHVLCFLLLVVTWEQAASSPVWF